MAPPDLDRLGGISWLERSGGRLTRDERRMLIGPILRTHVALAETYLRVLLGKRPASLGSTDDTPAPPDSALARAAEVACLDGLPPALAAHSFRTWWYGLALARQDGFRPDPELAYVAALLHDLGLAAAVPGEDFTLRSADRARQVLEAHGVAAADVTAVRDAISVHTLPGATAERDGPLGAYLQAGAMLDLVGLRACDLPAAVVRQVTERHPRGDLVPVLARAVRAESAAVPDGRFSQVRHWGLVPAVRMARGVG